MTNYKLFGKLYDRIPEDKNQLSKIDNNLIVYKNNIKLFDNENIIFINVSEFLGMNNELEFKNTLKKIKLFDILAIKLDINDNNKIINCFIQKRIKQIIYLLKINGINNILTIND